MSGLDLCASRSLLGHSGSQDVDLEKKNPRSELTLNNITMYQVLMAELKDTLALELDLIEGRVMTPAKEFKELLQRVRKTIVKRNHKVGI